MEYLRLKKCLKCGALITVLNDCNCEEGGLTCCSSLMEDVKANSIDAAVEKHVPEFEVRDGKLYITVNHVMDDDHFIEWILVKTSNTESKIFLNPGDIPQFVVTYEKGSLIYAYCNKHGLWEKKAD